MKNVRKVFVMVMGLFALSITSHVEAQEFKEIVSVSNGDLAFNDTEVSGYGTISGAGKIYMELLIEGNYISGRYYYLKTNKNRSNKSWIYLEGYYDWGDVVLYELANGRKNGKFVGKNKKGGIYKGTFYRNDGKRFSFNLNLN